MNKFHLVATIVLVFIISLVVGTGFSYHNEEVSLRARSIAQQRAVEIVFDETWKVIAQQAQVADKYKESFEEIYPALMEGRYGNSRGGALMSWITESNPEFNTALFEQLSRSIESKRAHLTKEQKTLLDIKREHDVLRTKIPSSLFVGRRPTIEVNIISSSKAKEALDSGQEENIKVF